MIELQQRMTESLEKYGYKPEKMQKVVDISYNWEDPIKKVFGDFWIKKVDKKDT